MALDPVWQKDESGQAMVEYVLLMAIIVGIYAVIAGGLNRMGLAQKLMSPLSTSFAAAYRYGHPKAKGFEDGGPSNHPRAGGDGRLFFNPEF